MIGLRALLGRLAREQVLRRVAFGLLAVTSGRSGAPDAPGSAPVAAVRPEDVRLLAMVAHWRGERASAAVDDCVIACLAALVALPADTVAIVVHTDRPEETVALLRRRAGDVGLAPDAVRPASSVHSGPADRRITVEGFRPRWPYRHGHYLTWQHKTTLRAGLDAGRFTHFLYLEDDIEFTGANLVHWLTARPVLAPLGLLPGFVRYERAGERRLLVDQTRSGQYVTVDPQDAAADALGRVVRSTRPYQACFLLDVALARHHVTRSPMRSPLRSRISCWGIRERAAAGEVFDTPRRPIRGVLALRAKDVDPTPRYGLVLVPAGPDASGWRPVEGSLIQHLRPTYSRDATSRAGSVPVDAF